MPANTFSTLLRPILTRMRGLLRRGTVSRVEESRLMRELQLRAGANDVRDRVEHFEPYGFTGSPLNDAEAILLNIGGDRAHTVAVVVSDRRHRPRDLNLGDVAVYAANGAKVILRNGGGIEITSPAGPVSITASELNVTGNIKATGNIEAGGNVADSKRSMEADRQLFNVHTHAGVQTGGGTTAPPLPQE